MGRRSGIARASVTAAAVLALAAAPATARSNSADGLGRTERVSVGVAGAEPTDASATPSVSADGRYVAFESDAANLVTDDTNGVMDVFVRDLRTGSTERVSVGNDGTQGDARSSDPQISADGRTVLFQSAATTLDPTSMLGSAIFVRDLETRTTRRLWVGKDGTPASISQVAFSGNGRFVAFVTTANLVRHDNNADNALDVYRVELATGKLRLVSVSRFGGTEWQLNERPSISSSGRQIAWASAARLVKRDHNRTRDIYVRDLHETHPRRVSVSSHGDEADKGSMGASISASGRYVVFSSVASTLVRRDTNQEWDVFIHDRRDGTTRRVSVADGGGQSNGQTQAYAVWGEHAAVSRDGRYVVFSSVATNLVAERTSKLSVFVRDLAERTTHLVSTAPDGSPANGRSSTGTISGDGSTVAFDSHADNLVTGDVNHATDVFVRRLR